MKKAMIFWFSEDDGGRKTPPKGAEYYPTIELEDGSVWSIAIKFDREHPMQNEMIDKCEVYFFFEDIEQTNLLKRNAEFIIYEGPHKVGAMVIL